MDGLLRKAGMVLGVTLLVTGWGLTRYAQAQQEAIASDNNDVMSYWVGQRVKISSWLSEDKKFISGHTLSLCGIISMGAGAAMASLALAAGRRFDTGV